MSDVVLKPVERGDLGALMRLDPGIKGLVAPNSVTLAQAAYEPGAEVFGVWAGADPVGLVALCDAREDPEPGPGDDVNCAYLWRLMIDKAHQRRGYGRAVMAQAFDWGRAKGLPRFMTSVVPDIEGNALPFYEGLGLARTGRVVDEEVELARPL